MLKIVKSLLKTTKRPMKYIYIAKKNTAEKDISLKKSLTTATWIKVKKLLICSADHINKCTETKHFSS